MDQLSVPEYRKEWHRGGYPHQGRDAHEKSAGVHEQKSAALSAIKQIPDFDYDIHHRPWADYSG